MRICLIEWVDSSFAQGWMSMEYAKKHDVARVASVGILVYEDKDKITIMQDVSNKEDMGDGITIPKCSIKRIRRLKIK